MDIIASLIGGEVQKCSTTLQPWTGYHFPVCIHPKAKPFPKGAAQNIRVQSGEHVQEFKVEVGHEQEVSHESSQETCVVPHPFVCWFRRNDRGSLKRSARTVQLFWASGRTRDPYFEILGASRGIMVTPSGGFARCSTFGSRHGKA